MLRAVLLASLVAFAQGQNTVEDGSPVPIFHSALSQSHSWLSGDSWWHQHPVHCTSGPGWHLLVDLVLVSQLQDLQVDCESTPHSAGWRQTTRYCLKCKEGEIKYGKPKVPPGANPKDFAIEELKADRPPVWVKDDMDDMGKFQTCRSRKMRPELNELDAGFWIRKFYLAMVVISKQFPVPPGMNHLLGVVQTTILW